MQSSSAPHSDGEPEDHRHAKPKLDQPFFFFYQSQPKPHYSPYYNHSLKMFQPSINTFPKRTNPLLGDLKTQNFPFFLSSFLSSPHIEGTTFFFSFTQITLTKNHRSVPLQLTKKDDILQYEIQPQVNHSGNRSKEIHTQKKRKTQDGEKNP